MRLSLRRSVAVLIASGLIAAALVATISIAGGWALAGATQRAYDAEDLSAEVLPPPLYLLELRLVLSEGVGPGNTTERRPG